MKDQYIPQEHSQRRHRPQRHNGHHGNGKKVRDYFTLEDFTRSQKASDHGIDNTPPHETLPAMRHLVQTVLIPVIEQFGEVMITSGYRCPQVNELAGGSSTSQHVWTSTAAACDFEPVSRDVTNLEVSHWIRDNCEFDQLISEEYVPGDDPRSGWIHVSSRTDDANRNQCLTKQKGSKTYSNGLPEL